MIKWCGSLNSIQCLIVNRIQTWLVLLYSLVLFSSYSFCADLLLILWFSIIWKLFFLLNSFQGTNWWFMIWPLEIAEYCWWFILPQLYITFETIDSNKGWSDVLPRFDWDDYPWHWHWLMVLKWCSSRIYMFKQTLQILPLELSLVSFHSWLCILSLHLLLLIPNTTL